MRSLPPEHALLLHGGERLREGIDPRKLLPVPRALACAAGVCELRGQRNHRVRAGKKSRSGYDIAPEVNIPFSVYAHGACLRQLLAPSAPIQWGSRGAEGP